MKGSTIIVLLGVVAMVSMFSAQPFDQLTDSSGGREDAADCYSDASDAYIQCIIEQIRKVSSSEASTICNNHYDSDVDNCILGLTDKYSGDMQQAAYHEYQARFGKQ